MESGNSLRAPTGGAAAGMRLASIGGLPWLAAILGGAALHVLIWQFSEPPHIFSDFYKSYWVAAEKLWTGGLAATYPFTIRGNWSNLPVIGWLYAPLAPLGQAEAAWTYWGLGLVLSLLGWAALVRLARLAAPAAALLLFLFMANGPLVNTLREGNSTHLLLLPMAGSLLLWRAKREFAAGVALGICATLKLPLLLLGVYFVLCRRWWIVAGGATAISAAVLASVAIFGIDAHIQWYADAIQPHTGATLPSFNVQSIDAFVMRLSTGARLLRDWAPIAPAPWQTIAQVALMAAIYCGAFWVLLRARQRDPAAGSNDMTGRNLVEFSVVLIIALVTSRITWTHYYALLLLPIALYLGDQLSIADDRATHTLMRRSIVLVSLPVVIPDLGSGPVAEIAARTLISAWLGGGLLMFWALLRGAACCPRPGDPHGRN